MEFLVKVDGRGFPSILNEEEVKRYKTEAEEHWMDEDGNLAQCWEDWIECSDVGDEVEFGNLRIMRIK